MTENMEWTPALIKNNLKLALSYKSEKEWRR